MTDEIFRAARDLMIAGIVILAYKTAREAKMTKAKVAWSGFLWCAGIALFAAVTLGSPSCEEAGDPIHGGCEQYADDGFKPSFEQRSAKFLYFLTLLYVPVLMGAFSEREKPPPGSL